MLRKPHNSFVSTTTVDGKTVIECISPWANCYNSPVLTTTHRCDMDYLSFHENDTAALLWSGGGWSRDLSRTSLYIDPPVTEKAFCAALDEVITNNNPPAEVLVSDKPLNAQYDMIRQDDGSLKSEWTLNVLFRDKGVGGL